MKRLLFSETIQAPVTKVYDTMLGISNKTTYEQWTAVFNPTSTFKGNWQEGSRMFFVGENEKGEKGGMISEIAKNTPHQFVSIKHIGMLIGDKELLEGPEVEPWAGCMENYTFHENKGLTTVTVELDGMEGHEKYFEETYPKALKKLKEISEN